MWNEGSTPTVVNLGRLSKKLVVLGLVIADTVRRMIPRVLNKKPFEEAYLFFLGLPCVQVVVGPYSSSLPTPLLAMDMKLPDKIIHIT